MFRTVFQGPSNRWNCTGVSGPGVYIFEHRSLLTVVSSTLILKPSLNILTNLSTQLFLSFKMKFTTAVSNFLLVASVVVASPTPTLERAASNVDTALEKRSTTFCGSYGSETAGQYTFYHNNWGASYATSGSQCTTFNDLVSNTVSWSTSWTWAGGSSNVKSYSNVAVADVNKQLSSISTINSIWKWRYVKLGLKRDFEPSSISFIRAYLPTQPSALVLLFQNLV